MKCGKECNILYLYMRGNAICMLYSLIVATSYIISVWPEMTIGESCTP
jgi:hypothetical protein